MSSQAVRGVAAVLFVLAFTAAKAEAAPPAIVTGVQWGAPNIRLFDAGGRLVSDFYALDSPRVNGLALGDLDGDGRADLLTGSGPEGPSRVTIFSRGGDAIRSFSAYAPQGPGGVFVATADLDLDGRTDVVTGAAAGGSHVKVWNGRTGAEAASFFAFSGVTRGGVSVATGDVNGDGLPEIVAGGGGDAGPLVRVFDRNGSVLRGFSAFDPKLGGGVQVAAGDVDGDRSAEIVIGVRDGSGPQVTLFDATSTLRWSRSPFSGATSVAVTVGDVDGDGRGDVVAAASVGGPIAVAAYDANGESLPIATGGPLWGYSVALATGDLDGDGKGDVAVVASSEYASELRVIAVDGRLLASFRPTPPAFEGGMRVAEGDVDRDGAADVITAPGYGRKPEIRVFNQQGELRYAFGAYEAVDRNGVYVAAGDVDGDGRAEVVVGPGYGDLPVKVLDGRTGAALASFKPYEGFDGGVNVAVGDLVGNGRAEIITGAGCCGGPHVQIFDGRGGRAASFFAFDADAQAGVNVAAGDVNGDGRDDIIAGSDGFPGQIKVFDGAWYGARSFGTIWTPDLPGVRVGAGDVDGDGSAEILAAGAWGGLVQVFRLDGTRVASFKPYATFDGGLFVASALRSRGPQLRNAAPFPPTVRGPRSTAKRRPVYVFSAIDADDASSELRFRCSFDSPRLHACAARYSQRLAVGRHVLRVQALDSDGAASPVVRVGVIVRRR